MVRIQILYNLWVVIEEFHQVSFSENTRKHPVHNRGSVYWHTFNSCDPWIHRALACFVVAYDIVNQLRKSRGLLYAPVGDITVTSFKYRAYPVHSSCPIIDVCIFEWERLVEFIMLTKEFWEFVRAEVVVVAIHKLISQGWPANSQLCLIFFFKKTKLLPHEKVNSNEVLVRRESL